MLGLRAIIGGIGGAKMRLIFIAGVLVLGGLTWNGGSFAMKPASISSPRGLKDSLRANWTEGSPLKDGFLRKNNRWSDMAVQLGLSFIAAMIFGSLLRVALKTAITLAVVGGALLWFLQSQGVIDPISGDYYDSVSQSRSWLMNQVGVVGHFLQTNLPSASAALIGFGFGLKR